MQSLTMFEQSRLTNLAKKPAGSLGGDDRRDLSALQTKVARSSFPVFQALRGLFGDSVDRIACDLPDTWLSEPVGQAYLCIGDDGLMQTICGNARTVACIPTANKACRIRFSLVAESREYEDWICTNAKNDFNPSITTRERGPCPSITLRLVAST